jgi:hypothetical protein
MSVFVQNEPQLKNLRDFWPNVERREGRRRRRCERGPTPAGQPWPTGRGSYQACESPQCGQPTEVETAAWKTKPQAHEYIA